MLKIKRVALDWLCGIFIALLIGASTALEDGHLSKKNPVVNNNVTEEVA